MKKSLVLAMAMALGVTASAYAANPFSDVPAGHWAYDSISKLAAAGIIEGYGDDTFRGDRLMTRYEMAQIVAKALAKGANVDKLAAEFADELDALGVRVAALEKKSDNVKITGQLRYRYGISNRVGGTKSKNHDLRSRIWFTGKVNDTWNYVGMLENIQNFTDNVGNETTNFQRAYLEGRLGGAKVTAGRYHEELVGGDSDVYSNRIDGIKVKYGKKLQLMGYYGKLTGLNAAAVEEDIDGNYKTDKNRASKAWGAHAGFDIAKKANIFIGYDEFKGDGVYEGISVKELADGTKKQSAIGPTNYENIKQKLFDAGVSAKFGDFGFTGIYLNGKISNEGKANTDKKNGYTLQVDYKGAKAAKPGSWGLMAKYYDQGNLTYWSHGISGGKGAFLPTNKSGFKGFRISGDYTVAKNMVARVSYFDLKAKDTNGQKKKTYYGELIVTF